MGRGSDPLCLGHGGPIPGSPPAFVQARPSKALGSLTCNSGHTAFPLTLPPTKFTPVASMAPRAWRLHTPVVRGCLPTLLPEAPPLHSHPVASDEGGPFVISPVNINVTSYLCPGLTHAFIVFISLGVSSRWTVTFRRSVARSDWLLTWVANTRQLSTWGRTAKWLNKMRSYSGNFQNVYDFAKHSCVSSLVCYVRTPGN